MKHSKKYTWLLLVSLFAGYRLSAQSPDEGASLGVKFGVNVTGYDLKEASLKTAPGFNLGLFSSVAFSKYFSLQPEINLNIQNSRISVNNELSTAQFNMLLSYIEFALSGRVGFGKLFLQAGPYISYLANFSMSNKAALNEAVSRKNFYDIDWGLVYSAGIQLRRWDFGVRYNQGIYEIGKPYTPTNNLNIFRDSKTSSYQLFAGYYF
jgi:outer membrane protein with beta-barrel domain